MDVKLNQKDNRERVSRDKQIQIVSGSRVINIIRTRIDPIGQKTNDILILLLLVFIVH